MPRENSGAGDARPQTKDPNLDKASPPTPRTDDEFHIGDESAPGESKSPSDRGRGEVSGQDNGGAVD